MRYVTANNAKEVVSGYYLQANSGLYSMSLSDSKYTASLPLEKGETATLINTYGEEVDNYTSVLAGTYNATYDNENLRLTTREVDVVLEAEDGVYDRRTQGYNGSPCTKAFANDEASGKFGACDMNNCGMGISLMHYSYFAGTYDVQIAYWTGTAGSKSLVSVNGVPQTTAYYNEANGWANNDAYPNITTVSLTFNQGWNSIALSKDGKKDDNPQYGGFVMLDYVKVLGKNTEFDPTEFNVLNPSFKVEAEHAAFETGGKLPQANTNASGGYFVGDYDVVGRYVTFNFYAPLDGQYDIQMGYAKWGNSPSVDVALNDEKVDTIVFDNYANEAWNNFNLNGYKTRVNLSSTELNSVKFTLTNSGVCFDYILLTYVGE